MPLPELITETPLGFASRCEFVVAFDVKVVGLDAADTTSRVKIEVGQCTDGTALVTLRENNLLPAHYLYTPDYIWEWSALGGAWGNSDGVFYGPPTGQWAGASWEFLPGRGWGWRVIDTDVYSTGPYWNHRDIGGGWFWSNYPHPYWWWLEPAGPLGTGPVWELDHHASAATGCWLNPRFTTYAFGGFAPPSAPSAPGLPTPPAPPYSSYLPRDWVNGIENQLDPALLSTYPDLGWTSPWGYSVQPAGMGLLTGDAISGAWQQHVVRYARWLDSGVTYERVQWSIDGADVINETHDSAEMAALDWRDLDTEHSGYVPGVGQWLGGKVPAAWPSQLVRVTVTPRPKDVTSLADGYNLVTPDGPIVDVRDVVFSLNGIVRHFDTCRDGLLEWDLGDAVPTMQAGVGMAGYEDANGLRVTPLETQVWAGTDSAPDFRKGDACDRHYNCPTATIEETAGAMLGPGSTSWGGQYYEQWAQSTWAMQQAALVATSYGRMDPHGAVVYGFLGDEYLLPAKAVKAPTVSGSQVAAFLGTGDPVSYDRLQPWNDPLDAAYSAADTSRDVASDSALGTPVTATRLGGVNRAYGYMEVASGSSLWHDAGSGAVVHSYTPIFPSTAAGGQMQITGPSPWVSGTYWILSRNDTDAVLDRDPTSGNVYAASGAWRAAQVGRTFTYATGRVLWSYMPRYAQVGQIINGLPFPTVEVSAGPVNHYTQNALPRLAGVTPDGELAFGCYNTAGHYIDDNRLRAWCGRAYHNTGTLTTEEWGIPVSWRLRSESALGVWDAVSRDAYVVGLQDRFASSLGSSPLTMHLCWQYAPNQSTGIGDLGLLADMGYTVADLAAPDTDVAGYMLCAATMTPSGRLWCALWRVHTDATLDLLLYRMESGSQPSEAILAATVTGVARPTFLTGRFLTDPVTRESFFWHPTRTAGATGARLYHLPPDATLPFTPDTTDVALGLSTIPAPPYGAWLTGNGLDGQVVLCDLTIMQTGKWRARCTTRGWFDYTSGIEAAKLAALSATQAQASLNMYTNTPTPPTMPTAPSSAEQTAWVAANAPVVDYLQVVVSGPYTEYTPKHGYYFLYVPPWAWGQDAVADPDRVLIDDVLDVATDADALCGDAAWTDRGAAEVVLV